jgi:hypothetical protein
VDSITHRLTLDRISPILTALIGELASLEEDLLVKMVSIITRWWSLW